MKLPIIALIVAIGSLAINVACWWDTHKHVTCARASRDGTVIPSYCWSKP